ncbi:hypothetical protein SAMN05216488_2017 [Microbacterium sp. LKL04]|nr:hypothetical protein SAMN05216488_2017 [Microbacterium sp. LKL04]
MTDRAAYVGGMSRRRASLVLVLLTGLALTGCAAPTQAPETSAVETPAPDTGAEFSPAAGDTITAEQYTLTLPDGWGFPDGAPEGFDETTFAADLTIEDGYRDNVNILVSPGGEVTSEQVEEAGVAQLEEAGASDVQALDRVTAAGSESAHLTARVEQGGTPYVIDQFYLVNAGQTYIVTFASDAEKPQAERDALAQSVLVTWQWV